MLHFLILSFALGNQPTDGQDLKSDTSIELFHYKCLEFYNDRREAGYGVNVTYVGEGAQGVVYRCDTFDPNSKLKYVAIKIYKNPLFVSAIACRALFKKS